MVTGMKSDRSKLAKKYESLMQKNKKDLERIYKDIEKRFKAEGAALAGALKAGQFSLPTDNAFDIKDENRYIAGFTEADGMKLEDPEKFLKLFEKNIDNLSRQVEQQQLAILGDPQGPTLAHAKQRKTEYEKLKGEAKRMSDECDKQYTAYVMSIRQDNNQKATDYNKAVSQLGEQSGLLCSTYSSIMSEDPEAGCKKDIIDLTSKATQAAANTNPSLVPIISEMQYDMKKNDVAQYKAANPDKDDNVDTEKRAIAICTKDLKKKAKDEADVRLTKALKKDFESVCSDILSPKAGGVCKGDFVVIDKVKGKSCPSGYGPIEGDQCRSEQENFDCTRASKALVAIVDDVSAPTASDDDIQDFSPECPLNNNQQINGKDSVYEQERLAGKGNNKTIRN